MRQGEWGVWYQDLPHGNCGWVPTWDEWEEYSGTEAQCNDKAARLNAEYPQVAYEARRLPASVRSAG